MSSLALHVAIQFTEAVCTDIVWLAAAHAQLVPAESISHSVATAAAAAAAGAETVTAEELSAGYAVTVRKLSVQLHLLCQPAECRLPCQEEPLQRIKQLLDR
jgi:hypothetical protein